MQFMSEKEANDYFKKLMNDTQNKIDDIDNYTSSLTQNQLRIIMTMKNQHIRK